MRLKQIGLSAIASVSLMMLAACGGNSGPSAAMPTPTPTVAVTSLTITSTPSSITTFQLTAAARLSDGSTVDVTSSSAWTTSNSAIATVSAAGLLTVVGTGEVEARATYQSVIGMMRMTVTAPPKFSLGGIVREVAPHASLLGSVRVEIVEGPDSGAVAMTDDGGSFRFSALNSGVVGVQATKDGFQSWRIANLTHDQNRDLEITLYPTPPRNAGGATATARCGDGTWSWATTRADACTANGGIAYGVCPGPLCDGR
jgi:hypothetical protein